jgi:hypothetical protein
MSAAAPPQDVTCPPLQDPASSFARFGGQAESLGHELNERQ